MYYLTGKENLLRTIILLGRTAADKIDNVDELKEAYLKFLNKHTTGSIIPKISESQYCYDPMRIAAVTEKFSADVELTDIKTTVLPNTSIESMENALSEVKQAQKYISHVNQELFDVFQFVIHTIYYTRSINSGGGSVSDALGVIWCSNKKSWTVNDLAEFLVHELTHNLLFLDELCYKHYTDFKLIEKKENFALSAILNRNRPLDKVFHSLIVAYEVIRFRLEAGEFENPIIHPSTDVMIESCLKTIESVNNLIRKHTEPLVTQRFIDILDQVSIKLTHLALQRQEVTSQV